MKQCQGSLGESVYVTGRDVWVHQRMPHSVVWACNVLVAVRRIRGVIINFLDDESRGWGTVTY